MQFISSVIELIRRRSSCRSYTAQPIEPDKQRELNQCLSELERGPLGSRARFMLIAADAQGRQSLRGLGTYGFIQGATGFIIGALGAGQRNLEDFGYLMEQIVLYATDLGLGTCWLGGTFTRSSFARRMALRPDEMMSAVCAVGYAANKTRMVDRFLRRQAGSDHRLGWEQLFFNGQFGQPLLPEPAGLYALSLEMVRLGPSASNKQPWRIVHESGRDEHHGQWHFYLQRSPGYRKPALGLVQIDDIQRVDMGIAMCHFALTAQENGLRGQWAIHEPSVARPDDLTEYIVTWQAG